VLVIALRIREERNPGKRAHVRKIQKGNEVDLGERIRTRLKRDPTPP